MKSASSLFVCACLYCVFCIADAENRSEIEVWDLTRERRTAAFNYLRPGRQLILIEPSLELLQMKVPRFHNLGLNGCLNMERRQKIRTLAQRSKLTGSFKNMSMLPNPPVPYDLCVGVPILYLQWINTCLAYYLNSVLNVKVIVATSSKVKSSRTFVWSTSWDTDTADSEPALSSSHIL